jgi:hypothetical protein
MSKSAQTPPAYARRCAFRGQRGGSGLDADRPPPPAPGAKVKLLDGQLDLYGSETTVLRRRSMNCLKQCGDGTFLTISDDHQRLRKVAPGEPILAGWHLATEAEWDAWLDTIVAAEEVELDD